jgi:hypothetical protein
MCHEAKTQKMNWCKQELMGIGATPLTKKAVFSAIQAVVLLV